MSKFSYRAKKGPNKFVDGVIEAKNVNEAISKITTLGLAPVTVNPQTDDVQSVSKNKSNAFKFNVSTKIKSADIVMFTIQMGDLLEASVPLLRCLQSVKMQTKNSRFQKMIDEMIVFVRDGGSFSDALAKYPKVFSPLYINMTKTAEMAGNLDRILLRLGAYLEKENETLNKIRASLAYPSLIVAVGFLTIFVLITFVIPRISVMFTDLNQELPLPTTILINVSGFFAQYWWSLVVIAGLVFFGFRRWLSTGAGRYQFDQWLLKMPLIGNYIKQVEIGRLSKTLATLLEGGLTITSALNSAWPTVNNSVLQKAIKEVSQKITEGTSLRAALQQSEYFPEIAVNMMASGEQTGQLEKGLYKIADIFEKQSDQLSKAMVSLLGPFVLIIIVGIVGFVVISMLLPIFKMNLIMQ